MVMVKKANGKWQMCTTYTDLNKACQNGTYPLRNIDRLEDEAAGHKILNFLDAYSSYNQICMHPKNKEKTTFTTDNANFYYKVMSFVLKNVRTTYQRLMNKVFESLIGINVEVYVYDIVVKSNSCE